MQQTDKYKLNLIETSDPFSPAALNENMEKVEGAISAEAAAEAEARAAGDAALDARVTALEAHRVYVGSYVGNGAFLRDIDLGFTPKAMLLLRDGNTGTSLLCLEGSPVPISHEYHTLEIIPNGFRVCTYHTGSSTNQNGGTYKFLAFA